MCGESWYIYSKHNVCSRDSPSSSFQRRTRVRLVSLRDANNLSIRLYETYITTTTTRLQHTNDGIAFSRFAFRQTARPHHIQRKMEKYNSISDASSMQLKLKLKKTVARRIDSLTECGYMSAKSNAEDIDTNTPLVYVIIPSAAFELVSCSICGGWFLAIRSNVMSVNASFQLCATRCCRTTTRLSCWKYAAIATGWRTWQWCVCVCVSVVYDNRGKRTHWKRINSEHHFPRKLRTLLLFYSFVSFVQRICDSHAIVLCIGSIQWLRWTNSFCPFFSLLLAPVFRLHLCWFHRNKKTRSRGNLARRTRSTTTHTHTHKHIVHVISAAVALANEFG